MNITDPNTDDLDYKQVRIDNIKKFLIITKIEKFVVNNKESCFQAPLIDVGIIQTDNTKNGIFCFLKT